jgi:hypothetical protein
MNRLYDTPNPSDKDQLPELHLERITDAKSLSDSPNPLGNEQPIPSSTREARTAVQPPSAKPSRQLVLLFFLILVVVSGSSLLIARYFTSPVILLPPQPLAKPSEAEIIFDQLLKKLPLDNNQGNKKPSEAEIVFDQLLKKLSLDNNQGNSFCRHLCFIAQAIERPPEDDRDQIISLRPDRVDFATLFKIDSIGKKLKELASGDWNVYAFVSDNYRPSLEKIVVVEQPSTQQVIDYRRAFRQLAKDWAAFRKQAKEQKIASLDVGDDLPFLQLLIASRGWVFEAPEKFFDDPVLPLFSDQDGKLLDVLDRWLNHRAARAALPPTEFSRLYFSDRITMRRLPRVLDSIKKAIDSEATKAAQSPVLANRESVETAYALLKDFFERLSKSTLLK